MLKPCHICTVVVLVNHVYLGSSSFQEEWCQSRVQRWTPSGINSGACCFSTVQGLKEPSISFRGSLVVPIRYGIKENRDIICMKMKNDSPSKVHGDEKEVENRFVNWFSRVTRRMRGSSRNSNKTIKDQRSENVPLVDRLPKRFNLNGTSPKKSALNSDPTRSFRAGDMDQRSTEKSLRSAKLKQVTEINSLSPRDGKRSSAKTLDFNSEQQNPLDSNDGFLRKNFDNPIAPFLNQNRNTTAVLERGKNETVTSAISNGMSLSFSYVMNTTELVASGVKNYVNRFTTDLGNTFQSKRKNSEDDWYFACKKTRIYPGEVVPLVVAGLDLLLIASNDAKNIYCVANSCPHLGTPLETGQVQRRDLTEQSNDVGSTKRKATQEDCIVCPLHRTTFSLLTGEVRGEWAPYPPVIGKIMGTVKPETNLPTFPVRVRGKNLEVRLSSTIDGFGNRKDDTIGKPL